MIVKRDETFRSDPEGSTPSRFKSQKANNVVRQTTAKNRLACALMGVTTGADQPRPDQGAQPRIHVG